ncbi:hypothetical protein ES703_111583 [subsurface metagenome]
MEIASIVGAVSGCLSLLGIVYLFGVWRGKVDNQLNSLGKSFQDYPPAEMWTMTKTLWDVYVMDALRLRPDLAAHGSAFKLKQPGKDLIPDYMLPLLDRIPRNPGLREDIATGYLVVKHIGLELISKMAEEKKVSIQEAIALLSTYLDNTTDNSS